MKYFLTILITLAYFFTIGCQNKDPNFGTGDLKHISSFGAGNTTQQYISRATSIDSDSLLIFVGDIGASKIKTFNLTGEHLYSTGNKGRGPGEFQGNLLISVNKNLLSVYDQTMQRVSLFQKGGSLKSSFITEERFNSSFKIINDTTLIAGSSPVPFQKDLSDEKLFTTFDTEGNVTSNFGEFPYPNEKIPATFLRYQFEVYQGKIFVLYTYFPLYEVYDLKNEKKISSIDLTKFSTFNDQSNYQEIMTNFDQSKLSKAEGIVSFAGGLEINNKENYFFTDVGDSLMIRKFNFDNDSLRYITKYTYPKVTPSRTILGAIDLAYVEENNSFYVLEFNKNNGLIVSQYGLKE